MDGVWAEKKEELKKRERESVKEERTSKFHQCLVLAPALTPALGNGRPGGPGTKNPTPRLISALGDKAGASPTCLTAIFAPREMELVEGETTNEKEKKPCKKTMGGDWAETGKRAFEREGGERICMCQERKSMLNTIIERSLNREIHGSGENANG